MGHGPADSCFFAPPLVATAIASAHYLYLFAPPSPYFNACLLFGPPGSPKALRSFNNSDAFVVPPSPTPQQLRGFNTILCFRPPSPGCRSHRVVSLHLLFFFSPPLVATAIAQRQRIFCFAPLRSHKHCAYSTHVLLFHLPWSPKPSRSVNAFFAPWSPQPSLGRHSHCVVYGRARSPNFHRVFRISRQGHRRVPPPPKATGESSRTALGFFGGFRRP